MRYTSTRDKNVDVSSSWAIAQGISADGGLFVPVEIPKVSLDDIAAMANMSYVERAKRVLSLYLTDFTAELRYTSSKRAKRFLNSGAAPHALSKIWRSRCSRDL